MKDPHSTVSDELYQRCNRTELLQRCALAGLKVRPNEATESLLSYLVELEDPPTYRPGEYSIDTWRDALILFFLDCWKMIRTQITCPARYLKDPINPKPKPCYGCTDMQVIHCVHSLKGNRARVMEHKVRR